MKQWDEAVESLDKVDDSGRITILDEDGGTTKVAYNPYGHCCVSSMMNDQFKRAWERNSLYVVKVSAPKSELTSGYKAEKAKDAVGVHKWKTDTVGRQLPENKRREILLTRWMKNEEVMPWEEVAHDWIKTLDGENIDVPFNVVPRKIFNMLSEAGVNIVEPEKGMENASDAYEQWLADPLDYMGDTELLEHVKALNSMKEVDVSFSKGSAKKSVEDVENINSKYGMRPDASCTVINSRGNLEKITNIVSPNIAKSLIEVYERGATGCAFSNINYVFIFRENNRSKNEEEIIWWHEQTHCVFRKLKYPQLEGLAEKALSWERITLLKNMLLLRSIITKKMNCQKQCLFS